MNNPMKTDDQRRLENWEETQRELRPGETVMDRLNSLRGMQRTPWHHGGFTRDNNGEVTAGAFSPVPSKADEAWEQSCQEMHSQQRPIELPNKPVDRSPLKGGDAVAEFHMSFADEEIPFFHESPGSTETQKKIKRGS